LSFWAKCLPVTESDLKSVTPPEDKAHPWLDSQLGRLCADRRNYGEIRPILL